MRFLVTNDDGYLAPGLNALARSAAALGDVHIVAPDREQSATSHSLTMHHPLRVRQVRPGTTTMDGTPTDCVALALGSLLREPPDVVLSGINHGANLGDDVLYSGTVAAAMEAVILGIPAIAISHVGREPEGIEAWTSLVTRLLDQILGHNGFPRPTLLNVNLPAGGPEVVQGIRVTTLGRRTYEGSVTRDKDPNGREYYWIGGGESHWWGSEDSDFRAIHSDYISVTPLHLDLTDYELLKEINSWRLQP
jgi:5'-nucleotidase